MTLYKEIELQEKERIVDSLATENQMLQEPKTPTKEQIKTIIGNVPREFDNFWYSSNLTSFIIFVITEWEKIRNKPN